MSRVQLELPESFTFAVDIQVRVTDINFAGHLGNDTLVSLLQEARTCFLRQHGLTDLDIFGAGIVVADLVVVYKSEAFRGETLSVEVAVADFNKYGCDFFYRVRETTSDREVARAKTGIVFFDYRERRISPVPEQFRTLIDQGVALV